jgi:hypothetical protein
LPDTARSTRSTPNDGSAPPRREDGGSTGRREVDAALEGRVARASNAALADIRQFCPVVATPGALERRVGDASETPRDRVDRAQIALMEPSKGDC